MSLSVLFPHANLALAAYAIDLDVGAASEQVIKFGPEESGAGMSASQAQQFSAEGWKVIDQCEFSNGASATIFEDKDGTRYLAVRGTEPSWQDFGTDGLLTLGVPPQFNPQYLSLKGQVKKWIEGWTDSDGVLHGPLLPDFFTVTGHSLGGYLAAALKTEFSQNITDAYLFNAPGIGGVFLTLADFFMEAIGRPAPGASGIWNVQASAGPEATAGLGLQLSEPITIHIEAATDWLGNHRMTRLSDALAVHSLFSELLPTVTVEQLNQIANASGVNRGVAPNAMLDALRRLIQPDAAPTGDSRETLHANLHDLRLALHDAGLLPGTSAVSLIPFANTTSASLASTAGQSTADGQAIRHALLALTPFALTGLDVPPVAFSSYPPEFWQARAEMLTWHISLNIQNVTTSESTPYSHFGVPAAFFSDNATGVQLYLGQPEWGQPNRQHVLFAGEEGETLTGKLKADQLFGGTGGDILQGGEGNDYLYGGAGDSIDILDGGAGADTLAGGAGNDWLGFRVVGLGGESIEEINSTGNLFDGGTGNDRISGSKGNDRYIFRKGDGQDFVQTQGGADELRLIARTGDNGPDIAESEVTFHKVGLDLQVRIAGTADVVTIMGWFDPQAQGAKRLATVTLGFTTNLEAGDKVWTEAEITDLAEAGASAPLLVVGTDSANLLQAPTGQAVALHGQGGNDALHGSSQNDFLYGGAGDDTLYGNGGTDVLDGGANRDTLYGGDGDDYLAGGAGNDALDGGPGRDYLYGGDDHDTLGGGVNSLDAGFYRTSYPPYGYQDPGAGNVYVGGRSNDLLRGTSRADLYLFDLGDGHDTIEEIEVTGQPVGQEDILRFGEGIAPSDIAVTRSNTDLVFSHANGTDRITVKNWYTSVGATKNQIERVEFAQGTAWTRLELSERGLTVHGTEGNDTLLGLGVHPFPDALHGSGGDDALYGHGGNDRLFGGDGDDKLYGGDDDDELHGGDHQDLLDGGRGHDLLEGGDGHDILGGGVNSADAGFFRTSSAPTGYQDPGAGNTYVGGRGNDLLRGTSRADLYRFDLGDGHDTIEETEVAGQPVGEVDVLRFGLGIQPEDFTVSRVGTGLVLAHINGTDKLTFKKWFSASNANQVERIEFEAAPDIVWSNHQLSAQALVLQGSEAAESLVGVNHYANTLYGAGGGDTLYGGNLGDELLGGTGNDTLYGGLGDDLYHFFHGDGRDTVLDTGGAADRVAFHDIAAEMAQFFRQGNDLVIDIDGSAAHGITVRNQFSIAANEVEYFDFQNGTLTWPEIQLMGVPFQ